MVKEQTDWWTPYVIAVFIMIGIGLFANSPISKTITEPVYYQYECDGELLNDSCSYAAIRNDGVLIKNCISNNEYFCQTAKELHN